MGWSDCRCCKKGSEDEAEEEKNPEVATFEGSPMRLKEVESHYKDIKNIYKYAIESMQNYLGKPCYPFITQPNQLYPYIIHLCEGLPDHEYVALKDEVTDKQLRNLLLTVTVKEANVIHPKITDFCRIFCKIWIDSSKEYLTSIKESSAALMWDETFVLDVENCESDVFHFEIWSVRPSFVERVTSFNFDNLKDDDPLAEEQGMYFLGDAVEYVKCLPCLGQSVLWTLKRGPRRFQTVGQINLFVELIVKKEEDFMLHFHCHIAFLRLAFEKQLLASKDTDSTLWRNWLEILPNPAITLLQQHAIQHGITPLEQCLCSWLVTSSLKMRLEDRISFFLLNDLMEILLENINEDSIHLLFDVLAKSISDFCTFAIEMLHDLHKRFDVENNEMADELYYMLRCISMTRHANFIECYQHIEEEAYLWYLKIIADVKGALENDESIISLGEGLKNIFKMYLRNQILLDDVFDRAWKISYSSITYKKLDSVVCTTIKPMIEHLMILLDKAERKTSESLKMLQLYHTARNLVNYIITVVTSQSGILRMDDYSNWFGEEMVLEWFLLCDLYTEPFIRRAVYADSLERMNKNIPHGTSVPDVSSIIDEMVMDVWIKLSWKEKFYTHGALIEAVKTCVLTYSEVLEEKLLRENFYCPKKQFEVNKKLCVALSNLFAILEHLSKTKKKIKLELRACEIALGFKISNPLLITESQFQVHASFICNLVFQRIYQAAKELMRDAAQNQVEYLTGGAPDICLYVDNSLEVLYCNLKSEAYHIILRRMWVVLLKTVRHGLSYSKFQLCSFRSFFLTKEKKMKIYYTVLQVLNQMKNIFYCDGHGLSHYEMENNLYKELKLYLEEKMQEK